MVLHDISMWFSSKEPVLDKTISRVNRCNGDKLASLEEALRNNNSLYQSGYFWCADHILFLSDNIIKSGKYDWSLCYVSVGGSIFKAHTVDWEVNEGRQATVEKNSNFCLIWSEARWGGGLASIVQTFHCDFNELVERLLFCNSELNCGNSPNWFITQRLEYQIQNGS